MLSMAKGQAEESKESACHRIEQWVLAVQQGERDKLEAILQHYEPLVCSLARRMSLSWEDACQEGRLAVIEAVYRYDPAVGCYFGVYLKRRVWAALRTLQRREWRWRAEYHPSSRHEEEEVEWWERWPDEGRFSWDDAVWLMQLTRNLSPRETLVLTKHVIEGRTLQELAKAEGVSADTVKTWKRRLVKKLRDHAEWIF